MKNVMMPEGSSRARFQASATIAGAIDTKKLTVQTNQSPVLPSTEGLASIHQAKGRRYQSIPGRPSKITKPKKTSAPADSRGTYRSRFGNSPDDLRIVNGKQCSEYLAIFGFVLCTNREKEVQRAAADTPASKYSLESCLSSDHDLVLRQHMLEPNKVVSGVLTEGGSYFDMLQRSWKIAQNDESKRDRDAECEQRNGSKLLCRSPRLHGDCQAPLRIPNI